MLRSEPRLTPVVLDELDRLDAALHAGRHGVTGASSGHSDGTTVGDASDELDRELLALVADVRRARPELDAGTRMRLEVRVQDANAAPAPRARRFSSDRRWRAGLALAAVVAVAIPVAAAVVDRGTGSGGPTVMAADDESSRPVPPSSADGDATAGSAGRGTSGEASPASPSPGSPGGAAELGQLSRQAAPGSADSTAPSPPITPTTKQAPPDAPRRVVRSVEQTVRIDPGDVARSAGRVTTIVQDAGGYLGSSEGRERGPAAGGTFQVVVPTGRLDATVAALSRIGEPVRLERSSSDVTDQAVSLDDRLKDLRADRAAARLALAKTVDPEKRAARRRELRLLSSRVAGLQGQRDALRRQAATSRIDLRLTTSRSADDDATAPVDDGFWGIGDAWDDAGRVLEVGGGVLLVGGAVLVPLAGLLGLGLVVRRRAAARSRDEAIDGA